MRFFPWKRKSSLGDDELLLAYRNTGDKALVGELYTRYAHLIYGHCLNYFGDRELARDAVLQVFEKLFETLLKQTPDNFKVWISFVARNHCISELRKRKTADGKQDMYVREETELSVVPNDDEQNPKEAQLQKLESAVDELGDEQRRCIELFYLQEKSYREIVAITGFSEKQVKSYLQNGKRNLKRILTQSA
jgi:RNA polymerase sigma factor (sigma-70 family)